MTAGFWGTYFFGFHWRFVGSCNFVVGRLNNSCDLKSNIIKLPEYIYIFLKTFVKNKSFEFMDFVDSFCAADDSVIFR